MWEYLEDSSDSSLNPVLQRAENQPKITSIKINESSDNTNSRLAINFADDGIELKPGEKVVFTYTMYVNDRFVSNATIGNIFEAFDKDGLISHGEYWKVKPNDNETEVIRPLVLNKSVVNANGIYLGEKPYINDVLIYTLSFKNNTLEDWNNIKISDTYTGNLSPFTGKNNISEEIFNKYGLNENKLLNISVAKDSSGKLIMPEGFDIDQINVVLDEDNNQFNIDLGNNVIKDGEVLQLNYTMRLNNTAKSKESIINKFTLFADNSQVLRGHNYWTTNDNADSAGIISNIKSVMGESVDGRMPDVNRLVDGDKLKYKVTLSNYIPRNNRVVNVKNVIDYMPKYITYIENSIKLHTKTSILNSDGQTYSVKVEEIPKTMYTITYLEDKNVIEVRFNEKFEQAGGIEGSRLNNPINSIEITYDGLVDSLNDNFDLFDPSSSREEVINTAVAFYTEDKDKLVAKSGSLVSKDENAKYQDNDDETNTYISSSSKVQVLNQNDSFAWISKKVLKNENIDLLNDGITGRKYEVTTFNTAFKSFDVNKIVDLLADYEFVDTSKDIKIIDNKDGSTYDAIYQIDNVRLDNKMYQRLSVLGYIEDGIEKKISLDAIELAGQNNSMSLIYETKIDKEKAKEELFYNNTYNSSVVNKVAMYTSEELTLFSPQGVNVSSAIKVVNDNEEDNNWYSDTDTNIRYETKVNVGLFTPAVAPYLDVRAQIVEVSANGITYKNVKDSDFINPGDVVAWKVSLGNSRLNNTPVLKAGTEIILELPDGLTFDGYADEVLPAYLDEVQVNEEDSTLIWKTNIDITSGSMKQFTVRTNSRSAFYEVYSVDGYLVTKDLEKYTFFDSKLYASNEYKSYDNYDKRRLYSFEPSYGQLPEYFQLGDDKYHYLIATENANVLGNLSIDGKLEVTSKNNKNIKASTKTAPHFITLNDTSDPVTFSMYLDVNKTGSGVKDIVFINRLANVGDRSVLRDHLRGSNAGLRLFENGKFKVEKVNATTGSIIQFIPKSAYTVQFTVKEYDYDFTNDDWDRNNNDIWMSEEELIASGYTMEDVSAFRVIIDNSIVLGMNESIKVSFDAILDEYHNTTWQAYNSFAYGATVDGVNKVKAETRSLGVKSKIFKDRMKIESLVIDPALDLLKTDFELELVSYNKITDEEVDRQIININVQDDLSVLKDLLWLDNLNRDYYYDIEAKSYDHYRIPNVELSSEKDQYGLTIWNVKVTYERIIYDEVEVKVDLQSHDKEIFDSIDYTLTIVNEDKDINHSHERNIDLIADDGLKGYDSIKGIETGHELNVLAQDIEGYEKVVYLHLEEELDTTGKKYVYHIEYKQIKEERPPILPDTEDEVDYDTEDEVEYDGEDSSIVDEKDNEHPNTGIKVNVLTYTLTLLISVFLIVVLILVRKRRHA